MASLLLFVNLVLNFPSVQTWLTHRIASYYSAKLHAKVQIGKVDFELLKKLVLRNVYVEDQHNDTLLYAEALKLDVGAISFDKHRLFISDIILDNTRFSAVMYKHDSDINVQFIIDYFASKDTVKHPGGAKWDIKVGALTMNNVYFSYRDEHNYSPDDSIGIIFTNMKIHEISGKISDIMFQGDTLRATIERLTAHERSGFLLQNMSCYVKLSSKKMELNALKIETPQTNLSTDLIFRYNRFRDFTDAVNKLDMSATFRKSTVCFDDVASFAHGIKGVYNCFTISGQYSGTVTHLKGRNMKIEWGKVSSFEGDATLDGLPDIQHTHINVTVKRLVTSKADAELLPRLPFREHATIKLPENIGYLRTIEASGTFDGYVTDFVATGAFSTGIGDIAATLSMRQDTGAKSISHYKGTLQTSSFNLGTFWQNNLLGSITSSVSIQGSGLSRTNADAKLEGTVASFGFKNYNYKNLTLSAELRKGFFSGLLNVNDPNLQMDFDGNVDIASKIHKYNFNSAIRKADLVKMNFTHDTIGQVVLSTNISVALAGNNIDSIDGTIHTDSTKLAYHKDNYHLKYLDLKSTHNGEVHNINVSSDYADASLSGRFPLRNIGDCFRNMLSPYIPSLFSPEKYTRKGKPDYHSYSFDLHFNNNTGLTNLFIPSLIISKGSEIKVNYDESNSAVTLSGNSALVEWASKKIKRVKLNASGDHSRLIFRASCDTLFLSDSLYAAAFAVSTTISQDTTRYTVKWNNDTANYADIPGYLAFPNKTDIVLKFVNPVISLGDSVWQANSKNTVLIDSSGIMARDLEFYHTQQYISIAGKISKHKNDAMVFTFKKLNLEDVKLGGITKLQGTVDGTASVARLYERHPFFAGSLNFSSLKLNKQPLGDGNVNCYWDNSAQAIALNGQFTRGDTKLLYFVGNYYDRDTNNLSADVTVQAFPVKLFEPYIKDYSTAFEGGLTGSGHVSGDLNKPKFSGEIIANITKFKLDYLNTYYHSSDIDILISPDTFRVKPSTILDEKQNSAIASGTLTHNHFKDFLLNFNLDAKKFMCLNTTEFNNDLYYGTGYATGNVQIYGPLNSIHIDASITTEKGTAFNIPLSNASEVDQSDVIRFVNKKDTARKKKLAYKVNLNGLQMHFTVHATPDATARLIFAEKVGDILEGTGSGTLQMDMSPQGDFSIKGDYTVTDGTYDFTFGNALSKKFALEEGGTISWSGDPYNADIDLNAIYKLRTSLEPLQAILPQEDSSTYKKTFPVYCDLGLTGKLTAPTIKFNIDLPTVDQNTQEALSSYLASNPNELYNQVASLLIIKSFLPIDTRPGAAASPSASLAAGINSTEFLSDQLSNMLSSISNKFNVGINYQPGTTPNNQELQVMFSTQLFNDRISINGDAGTVGNTTPTPTENTNNIVGEVTVEYKLSKDGKVKVKAFNKANDNTTVTLINAPYTQGAGISYRESFNNFSELVDKIKNKFKHNPKKEQNTSGTP